MACIPNESAHLFDRVGAVGKSAVNPGEHGVERSRQATDFGIGCCTAESLGEVATGEPGCGHFDFPEGAEGGGDQKTGQDCAEQNDGETKEQENCREASHRGSRVLQVNADDEGGLLLESCRLLE